MSLRRDVQKLTDSKKWARIQEKFQENDNEVVTLSDVPQKGCLQLTKDFYNDFYKNDEAATIDVDKKLLKGNSAINDRTSAFSQSKQTDADTSVKISIDSLEEPYVESKTQLENITTNTVDNLSDSEMIKSRKTFATKTFSEIVEENLRLLHRNSFSTNKVESNTDASENGKDKMTDLCNSAPDTKLVEKWLYNNYNRNKTLSVQNDKNITKSEQMSKPCHIETTEKFQYPHIISHRKMPKNEMPNYVLRKDCLQKNLPTTRRSRLTTRILPLHINNIERRKTFRYSCPSGTSLGERRKYLRSKTTVKHLIHKFEKISNESLQETQDDDSYGGSIKEQNDALLNIESPNECCSTYGKDKIHSVKVIKNRDDSGISEGEESTSPKHINQTFNLRLIESYNKHLNKMSAETNEFPDSIKENFADCVPKHIYDNLCISRTCRETKRTRSKSPRPNLVVKKPVPLPRSHQSQHYFHISDCYSGYHHQQKDAVKKKSENSAILSQSEEEWADISEEEREVISYSKRLANVSKKMYDFKIPVHCPETVNLSDCSPVVERWNNNANGIKDDNSTGDSSWETLSLHQQEDADDGDKSSTASSEHHYEAINDFLKFEPENLSNYRSDQQNPDDFIRESFNFLDTHSADESDDIESPSALSIGSHPLQNNYRHNEKRLNARDKLYPSFESRDSITESILMYQELSAFRRSFKKKTFKSILKENALESNKLKKQSLFSKNSKEILNFHVPWFSKNYHSQKLQSYVSIPEQLNIDSPELKEKKKGNYFTMPHPKKMSRSEQCLENLSIPNDANPPKNFNSSRRASDSSPLSSCFKDMELAEENQAESACHESSGNENNLQSQSSSVTNVSEGNRISVVSCVSCSSCMDDYICRKHLESTPNSSSSEESINCLRSRKPIDVQFVKIRKRVESTGSEHSYFQVTQVSEPVIDKKENTSYEQVLVNDPNNNSSNDSEEQNNSELYCELNSSDFQESSSEAHMSIEEVAFLSQNGEKKLWSDLPEIQKSGVLEKMSAQELKLQEAVFNVAVFEATYLRLLETYQEHFVRSSSNSSGHSLCRIISWHEWHLVFSDSLPIIDVSKRLIADIEHRWDESYMCFDIADILYDNITTNFHAYVKYCSNKPYRDRMLKVLMNTKPKFAEVTRHLEASSVCQGLLLHEFLMLPANHISDLLILIEEVFHWLPSNSSKCNIYNEIMDFLRRLKIECEKGALQMERMEEMLLLAQQIIFKDCKPLSLISVSRWLLKRGEMTHLICDVPNKRTFVKSVRWNKVPVYIFLFNDFLIVTKRRSEENYNVLDYCPKNIVHAEFIDDMKSRSNLRPPSNYKNLLQLTLWSNHKNKTVEMILNCPSESEKIRWGEALISDEVTDSDVTEKQDNFHVQCIQPYTARQADELTLFESDVVKVLKKVNDGWYKGKYVKDGNIGWFPAACVTEINILDIKLNHLSLGHKYSQVSTASSPKIPVSPK